MTKLFKKKKKKTTFQDITETVDRQVTGTIDPAARNFLTQFLGGSQNILGQAGQQIQDQFLPMAQPVLQNLFAPGQVGVQDPGTQAAAQAAADFATRAVADRFTGAGRTGSPAEAISISRNVGQAVSPFLFQDVQQQRALQQQGQLAGLQFLPQAAQVGLQQQAAPFQNFAQAASPFLQAASLFPGGQQTVGMGTSMGTTGGFNTLGGQIFGGATAALPFLPFLSDRRLKRNIRKFGEIAKNVGLYMYQYLWEDKERIGVMADEVPEFSGKIMGYKYVDYGRLIWNS